MAESDHISGVVRCIIGALGGIAAAGSKYLGQDHSYYLRMLDQGNQVKIDNLLQGYYVMVPILMIVGAIIAWAASEDNRMKLLTMAVSAPAIITTLAGGETTATKWAFDMLASPAYAQGAVQTTVAKPSVADGIKLWFGIGKDEQRYRVVIGSYKSEGAAVAKAAEANKLLDPTLKAVVGDKKLFNDYYPVIVGGYASYPAARALRAKVSEKLETDDVYLSPFSW